MTPVQTLQLAGWVMAGAPLALAAGYGVYRGMCRWIDGPDTHPAVDLDTPLPGYEPLDDTVVLVGEVVEPAPDWLTCDTVRLPTLEPPVLYLATIAEQRVQRLAVAA